MEVRGDGGGGLQAEWVEDGACAGKSVVGVQGLGSAAWGVWRRELQAALLLLLLPCGSVPDRRHSACPAPPTHPSPLTQPPRCAPLAH